MIALERMLYCCLMAEKLSTTTRERIVTASAELMRRQGYGATTVKQVTLGAAAPIGSLYHHFPGGKQQIAAEVLRTTGAAYIELLPLLMDPHDDLRDAITVFFSSAAEVMEESGWINMCPVVTIAGEVADSEPELREVAGEVITFWIDRGTEYLSRRGLSVADARRLTLAMLSGLEGGFILARTLRSAEPLLAAGDAIVRHLDGIIAMDDVK